LRWVEEFSCDLAVNFKNKDLYFSLKEFQNELLEIGPPTTTKSVMKQKVHVIVDFVKRLVKKVSDKYRKDECMEEEKGPVFRKAFGKWVENRKISFDLQRFLKKEIPEEYIIMFNDVYIEYQKGKQFQERLDNSLKKNKESKDFIMNSDDLPLIGEEPYDLKEIKADVKKKLNSIKYSPLRTSDLSANLFVQASPDSKSSDKNLTSKFLQHSRPSNISCY